MTQSRLPLEGIRVIDFTQVEMGPICSQMLGDFGADVIKIERRDVGEIARGKIFEAPGESPPFLSLNRNKRSLALDLKKPEAMRIVWKLIETADVILNNFRPDVMGKARAGLRGGLEAEPAHHLRERQRLGADGTVRLQGRAGPPGAGAQRDDGPPGPARGRPRQGEQPHRGLHLRDAARPGHPARAGRAREDRPRADRDGLAARRHDLQPAAGGRAVAEHGHDAELGTSPDGRALPDEGRDDRHRRRISTEPAARPLRGVRDRGPLRPPTRDSGPASPRTSPTPRSSEAILAENFKKKTTAEWLERLEAIDFLCTRVLSLKEALEDPQVRHNGMVIEMDHPQGKIKVVGNAHQAG